MKIATILFSLALAVAFPASVYAQPSATPPASRVPEGVIARKAHFKMNADSMASFAYYEVYDTTAMLNFTQKTPQKSFPLIIVRKPVFDPFYDLLLSLEAELDTNILLTRHYKDLDAVQQQKITQFLVLDSIQNQRIENYQQLTKDMREINLELSTQLTAALKTAKDCSNKQLKKKVWIGILGGAVGFSVAGLIALAK